MGTESPDDPLVVLEISILHTQKVASFGTSTFLRHTVESVKS